MEVSELPLQARGRKPIDTRTISLGRIEEVVEAVGRAGGKRRRAYWICPLIEESEIVDLAAAEARYEFLRKRSASASGLCTGG